MEIVNIKFTNFKNGSRITLGVLATYKYKAFDSTIERNIIAVSI